MQSCIVIRIVSWHLYRDTYRIVTLLVIHSTSKSGVGSKAEVQPKVEG